MTREKLEKAVELNRKIEGDDVIDVNAGNCEKTCFYIELFDVFLYEGDKHYMKKKLAIVDEFAKL